jgi:FAD dependent oxidoreductase TIGR03364
MQRAVVIGGGILGTMHALYLRRAGLDVIQVEAEAGPVGASMRNFGLVWVSGRRAGPELAAARLARRLWEAVSVDVPGVGFRAEGSLTVAVDPTERKVMEAYADLSDAAEHDTRFLEPDELRRVNPAIEGDVAGGLWCTADAIVEPRLALGAFREYLSSSPGYRFVAGRRIVAVEAGVATDQLGGRWEADVIVAATGAWHDGLLGAHLAAAPVRRVRLQMLETAPAPQRPAPQRLTTSVADADSLRYYPAYEVTDLDVLPAPSELAAWHHLQLLMVQRVDGGLTIGDTHAYNEPFAFDLDEAASIELLARAERILGRPLPPVGRRWEGVYSQTTDPDRLWYRQEVEPGIWVVTGPGGRGMTCAPAIATETVAALGLPTPWAA